jgi:hypothetical protein
MRAGAQLSHFATRSGSLWQGALFCRRGELCRPVYMLLRCLLVVACLASGRRLLSQVDGGGDGGGDGGSDDGEYTRQLAAKVRTSLVHLLQTD